MASSPETAPSPPVPADSDLSSQQSPPSPSSSSSSSSPPPESSPPSPETSTSPSPPTPSENPPSDQQQQSSPPAPTDSSSSSSSSSPPPASQSEPTPSAGASDPPPNSSINTPVVFSPPSPGTRDSPSRQVSGGTSNSPPAPHSQRSSSSSSSSSSDSSSNTAVIGGVAVAGILLLAAILVCLACCRRKKRRPYYMDPARPPKGGDYMYNGAQPWGTNSQKVEGHVVKLPPPPGGGGWAAPPPPPMGMNSGEYSSGYSGTNHGAGLMPPPSPHMGLGFNQSTFTYEELAAATGGFSQANLLGQGGFGFVHKGVLPNGKEVAVKSLKSGSGQGEREFQAEVEIISRVHHRHLVSLVGYCIADGQRMLVYEYVENKTLEFHLHGKGQPTMEWATRLRIALGSAKGLAYLHEDCHPRIIHRDIKAANILLDSNFEAMVADFGLAKLSSDNYTHVSTRVMGTFGYLAPEYAASGKLTEKSDVFSFGVMLLELITGRRPVDPTNVYMEDSLVDWARPLLARAAEDGNYDELLDPRLEKNYPTHELVRMAGCAAASIRHSAKRRPKMSQIVRALEGDSSLEDLNEVKPGQSLGATGVYDTGAYNADMMKFRKMVLSSSQEDFNSSDYGATSEYGLNPSSSSSETANSGPHRQKL